VEKKLLKKRFCGNPQKVEKKLKFRFLGRKMDFPLFSSFHIQQNPKIFHGIPPVESAF
jgi:hypothetical protein